jgi:competence protein ComGC
MSFRDFLNENRAQAEWSSLYMLVILIIVALLLVAVVKPMFQQSQKIVTNAQPQPSNS